MTQEIQQQEPVENVRNDKEYNFGKLREQLERERSAKEQLEQRMAILEQAMQQKNSKPVDDEDEDTEPYVDTRKLNKKLSQFGEQTKQATADIVRNEVQKAIYEERKQAWFKNNPDFQKVMREDVLNKFEQTAPDLAQSILSIPDEFERQKLAYANIKALRLDQPEIKQPSVQEKIDANRRSPYYQPTGVGSAPYASQGDFSPQGQKAAYDKMQQLKAQLRG